MGRVAEGWKLKWVRGGPGEGTAYVRFTHQGERHEESTGERDPEKAAVRAGEIYADVVSGKRRRVTQVVKSNELDECIADWIAEFEKTHDKETASVYLGYSKYWVDFFENSVFKAAHEGRRQAFVAHRLTKVLRSSVLKELAALNGFFEWCRINEIVSESPPPIKVPEKALGVRSGPQRAKATELSPEQVEAFFAALPEWSKPKGPAREEVDAALVSEIRRLRADGMPLRAIAETLNRRGVKRKRGGDWFHMQVREVLQDRPDDRKRMPIRDRFILAYETGLRPSSIDKIKIPQNWQPGSQNLVIDRDMDKGRFDRTVPLSPRAVAVLEKHAVASGYVFGRHDYRTYVKAAAKAARLPKTVSPYDMRHARTTHLLETTGNIPGVQFLVGHKHLSTTTRYVKASARAAAAVLAQVGSLSGISAKDGT